MRPTILILGSYLLGSIPFSYLVVRLVAGEDIRKHGSRNVGATNVARTAGRGPGVIALLLDIAKGYAAIEFARWLTTRAGWPFAASATGSPLHSREFWVALAGLIAVLAHMFPVWLHFHGGKGVATAAGVFMALDPRVMAAAAIVFLIVIVISRTVSLGSIISAASVPVFFRYLVDAPFWRTVVSILISIAVIAKHHSNIARMAHGKERRMGERKEKE